MVVGIVAVPVAAALLQLWLWDRVRSLRLSGMRVQDMIYCNIILHRAILE